VRFDYQAGTYFRKSLKARGQAQGIIMVSVERRGKAKLTLLTLGEHGGSGLRNEVGLVHTSFSD